MNVCFDCGDYVITYDYGLNSLCLSCLQKREENNNHQVVGDIVAEDFRIISRTETEEEKTFTEKLFDDAPSFQSEDKNNNNDDEDEDEQDEEDNE